MKIVNYANGIRYEGQLKGAIRNGQGIMTWPNGERYEGEWRNDVNPSVNYQEAWF